MKRWWVKALIALVVVLALGMLVLQFSGARSKNAVEAYKAQLRAAGEKLDWNELVPAPIPSDENSIGIFLQVTNLMNLSPEDVSAKNPPTPMRAVSPGIAIIRWRQPDVRDDYSTNSWEEMETGLAARVSILELLQKIPERPRLQFDLDYEKGAFLLLPHLIKLKKAAQLLSTAAICDLHDGNTPSAVTNIHASLALVNAWQDEPLLISQLVRIAMAQIAFSAQWELLQATNVTDEQLVILQNDSARLEFVQPMEEALEMERAWASMTIQQLRTSNSPSASFLGGLAISTSGGSSGDFFDDLKELGQGVKRKAADVLWRASWSYSDELNALKGDQVLVESTRTIQTNGFFKDALAEAERKLKLLNLDKSAKNWLRDKFDDDLRLLGSVESIGVSLKRVLAAEAMRINSITAIALKRYQLRHGKLPSDLNALVPEFVSAVPRDPVDGKPLRYRLNSDGTFLLYSIGEDGNDDGGDPSPASGSGSFQWQRGRDWVWPQAATPEETQLLSTLRR